jgi:hypothetical protein
MREKRREEKRERLYSYLYYLHLEIDFDVATRMSLSLSMSDWCLLPALPFIVISGHMPCVLGPASSGERVLLLWNGV